MDRTIRVEQPALVLTEEHLRRMDLPVHFWGACREQITAALKGERGMLGTALDHYLRNWEEIWQRGAGLLLIGPNGVGKTGAAAWLAKEVRRRNKPVLFAAAADLFDRKVTHVLWEHDPSYTYWQWAKRVPLLIVDDFGKEHEARGQADLMWDELFRARAAARNVTILTTNMPLRADRAGEGIAGALKVSTWSILRESMIPLVIQGDDRRVERGQALLRLVQGGSDD